LEHEGPPERPGRGTKSEQVGTVPPTLERPVNGCDDESREPDDGCGDGADRDQAGLDTRSVELIDPIARVPLNADRSSSSIQ
jgi:hypothetical protein